MPIIADLIPASGPTLDALTFTVIGEASAGVKEIGDELVLVTAVDQESGTCTVHPRQAVTDPTPPLYTDA